ncbi:hypothetical protein DMENIID0001_034580 [Sergentomyia squamirostris]
MEENSDDINLLNHKLIILETKISELSRLWLERDGPEVCQNNLRILFENLEQSFKTVNFRKAEKIKKYHAQAIKLRNILQVDYDLSQEVESTLHVRLNFLKESLIILRVQLQNRKDEIYDLLMEQEELCQGISTAKSGELRQKLTIDPLPSAEEIMKFRQHLQNLKNSKN